jgi:circadian clock protein KaiC
MTELESGASFDRMPTGIVGFDAVAGGGLPRGRVTAVIGGVGTGKTTFGVQVLASGARDSNEPGILVAFEERGERVLANTAGFAWGGRALGENAIHVIDAQLPQSVAIGGEFDLVGFLAVVGAKAEQVGARRIVFDGLDVLLSHLADGALVRREVFRLSAWVEQSGLTAILTAKSDATGVRGAGDFDFLEFLADCVVTLHHRVVEGTALRSIRIVKYRGASHSANQLPLTITTAGLEVASNTTSERVHAATNERVPTGIARLDAMLDGGYHRGSSVLITGAPGTAKTILGAAFAEAAAARGERTILVSFDESPDQVVRNVASIGIRLGPHIESGALRVHSLRARSESPEAHVARIRALMRELSPQNLVIDPLSAMTQRGCEGEAEAAALQILDLAKTAGMTLVSTSLLGNALPLIEHSPHKISTIADTWMHVSYENRGGERNRALTVIKSRGTSHSNQVRELVLTSQGVTFADVYAVGGEVLMGTLRWQKENEARRALTVAQNDASLRQRKAEDALAATKAQLDALVRAQAIQEEELVQLRAESATERGHRAGEDDELLQRRRADPTTSTPTPGAPPAGGAAL